MTPWRRLNVNIEGVGWCNWREGGVVETLPCVRLEHVARKFTLGTVEILTLSCSEHASGD